MTQQSCIWNSWRGETKWDGEWGRNSEPRSFQNSLKWWTSKKLRKYQAQRPDGKWVSTIFSNTMSTNITTHFKGSWREKEKNLHRRRGMCLCVRVLPSKVATKQTKRLERLFSSYTADTALYPEPRDSKPNN